MKDKINILFLTVQLETIGGSERLIYHLASNLDRNLFNPSVAWLDGEKVLKEFTELGIPLFHIPKMKRFDISTIQKIKNIIKLNNIHIVNAHHFMPMFYSFYGCKVGNHRKLLYTEHSQWEVQKIPWKWEMIGTYILSKSDGAVGVNPDVAKEIQKKFKIDSKKVFTILNGVDIKSFKATNDKSIIKSSMGLSAEDKVIGIVANFKRIKNHIFLLQAFYELVKAYNNVKLIMIGEGYEKDPENSEQEIRNYVKEKDLSKHILFLGYRSDIPDILNMLDIFCLTSFKEGLPISLIEAMAAGLPIAGTDVEGIRDVIVSNKNGLLVQIGDIDGLKNALLTLLMDESLRKRMGQESKNMARHSYSLEQCIKQYQDLFMTIMKKK